MWGIIIIPKYRLWLHGLYGLFERHCPLSERGCSTLTHWGRVTHICISKLTIIGSYNGLSPGRYQAIIWTNAGILLIGPLRINFSEILIKIHTFWFKKMRLKISSAKWRASCLSPNVLISHSLTGAIWLHQGTIKTRTTRTPTFWDTPHRPMITHTSGSHQIPSQNKTKSKLQILKNCQKFKFWNFARNFTRDTPSEVAW